MSCPPVPARVHVPADRKSGVGVKALLLESVAPYPGLVLGTSLLLLFPLSTSFAPASRSVVVPTASGGTKAPAADPAGLLGSTLKWNLFTVHVPSAVGGRRLPVVSRLNSALPVYFAKAPSMLCVLVDRF